MDFNGFETLAFIKALCSCYEGLLKAHEIDREMNLHEVRGEKMDVLTGKRGERAMIKGVFLLTHERSHVLA